MDVSLRQSPGILRPLNILRDLGAVADLIELSFRGTMDGDGRRYLDDMRRSANDKGFLNWAARAVDSVSLPLQGFVWEDGGRVVGNVSLIPFHQRGRKIYLIANVATHPDYRLRGIGRRLTEAAVGLARERRANDIWLHVRDDNPAAIHLYEQLGFVTRFRRTQWRSQPHMQPQEAASPALRVTARANADWKTLEGWFAQAYPDDLFWYESVHWRAFRPGLRAMLETMFSDSFQEHWSAFNGRTLRGGVTAQHPLGRGVQVWLSAPASDAEVIHNLLLHLKKMTGQHLVLNLEYPYGEPAQTAIAQSGFEPVRTLLWMQYTALQRGG